MESKVVTCDRYRYMVKIIKCNYILLILDLYVQPIRIELPNIYNQIFIQE
jgi:hypothetical protein